MTQKINNKISEKDWLNDFNEFASIESNAVPKEITDQILKTTHNALNPSAWIILFKLLGIHSVVGTLSLGLCNQFGINPFHTNFSLSNYFMEISHSFCMTMCGILFISLSIIFASLIFRQEEFRVLYKNSLLLTFTLSSFSLGIFILLGAEISLSIGLLWFFGAMFGGILSAFTINNSRFALSNVNY